MLNLVFYFQVHQPFRLKHYSVLNVGRDDDYFDHGLNGAIMAKVAHKCYLPANRLFLELIERHEGRFKVAYSLTGTVVEQFRLYAPDVLESFKELASTGCVEFLGETYYHSLAALYDEEEFLAQVEMHRQLMKAVFGFRPITFRNTELIFQDALSDLVGQEDGFRVILAEGAEKILKGRSPLYAYQNYNHNLFLLLKYYSLADDIAFRFSDQKWIEYPLSVDKFIDWVSRLSLIEKRNRNLFLNLFMDYETFGEHQWAETGIFDFIRALPEAVFKHSHLGFAWPSDAMEAVNYSAEALAAPTPVSWADTERDLSAWLENDLQHNAAEALYELLDRIKGSGRQDLLERARWLTTSDHLYYMSTKYFQDGDVHKYFSPYPSPEEAYIFFMNALADLEERLG